MKKNRIITPLFISLLFITFACSEMNDKHDFYLKDGERIYIGKVDSLHIFPGDNRVQFNYWVSDPRCKKVGFYWYPENDSVMVNINKVVPSDTLALLIGGELGTKSISQGSYTLRVITYDDKGNHSVTTEEVFNVYGDDFRSSLINRPLQSVNYEGASKQLTLNFSEFAINEAERGVQIFYTDADQANKTIHLSSDRLNTDPMVIINNLNPEEEVTYQTLFLPEPTAIDIFITERSKVEIVEIVNVALKKPVKVSDVLNSSYPGALAVDGIKFTTPSRWVSSGAGEHWIEIDLLGEYNVFSIQQFIGAYGPLDFPVANFMYQVDVDGKWVTVAEVTGNTDPGHVATFPEIKTSKVRYFVPDYPDNMVRMYEIEVWARVTY